MAHIYSNAFASGILYGGGIYQKPDGSTTPSPQTLPAAVSGMNRKAVFVKMKNRLYLVGQFSRPLVRTEDRRWWPVGITAPPGAPVLALGTGSGGAEGAAVGYITFRHKIGNKLIHESNPSDPSNTLEINGQGRRWPGIPTTSIDQRVTHVAGYVSMDGAFPRFAWERRIGDATEVIENVHTLALGDVLSFRRGVPPYTYFAESYHDRMWYFGDPLHPERIWYSELNEPESVHPENYRNTRNLLAVSGGKKATEDQFVIFTRRSIQDIQGYTGNDFNVRLLDSDVGCISHFSIVNIHNRLWFAGEEGVYMFDSSPHFMMRNLRKYWRADLSLHATAYANCYAANDKDFNIYKLLIPYGEYEDGFFPGSFYYCGEYLNVEPSLGGSPSPQPRWNFDSRSRTDSVLGGLSAEGSDISELHTGSCDGIVRKENIATDPDDNADNNAKEFDVQTPLDFFEDLGGDRFHGKQFTDYTLFVRNEDQEATIAFYIGGEEAAINGFPLNKQVLPGAVAGYIKRTSVFIRLFHTGEGISRRFHLTSPVDVAFKGDAGAWYGVVRKRPKSF